MKKLFLPLIFVFISIVTLSCQDEFCLEPTTPNLIVRFINKDTITQTKRINLRVETLNQELLFANFSGDSLVLPLNTNNTNTAYTLSIVTIPEDPNEDIIFDSEELTINYETEDVFVSKSCGYKSIFNNVNISTTNNSWLSKATSSTENISNQNQAHVQIFH